MIGLFSMYRSLKSESVARCYLIELGNGRWDLCPVRTIVEGVECARASHRFQIYEISDFFSGGWLMLKDVPLNDVERCWKWDFWYDMLSNTRRSQVSMFKYSSAVCQACSTCVHTLCVHTLLQSIEGVKFHVKTWTETAKLAEKTGFLQTQVSMRWFYAKTIRWDSTSCPLQSLTTALSCI